MPELLVEVARRLVAADRDVERAFESLPHWDVSAAHLQGRLYGIAEAFAALTGMTDERAIDDAVEAARTLLRETYAKAGQR